MFTEGRIHFRKEEPTVFFVNTAPDSNRVVNPVLCKFVCTMTLLETIRDMFTEGRRVSVEHDKDYKAKNVVGLYE